MVDVVGYTRISSVGQRSVDGSLRLQEEIIRDTCRENGWNLIDVFTDDGRSGTSIAGRPAFQAALDCARNRLTRGDHFLIATDSRFGRNAPELIPISQELFHQGIIISTAEGDFDNSNYEKEYQWYDLQLKSAKESRRNSYETTRTMRSHAANGRYQAKAPLGYLNVKGVPGRSLEVVQSEAEVVRWLFSSYAEGCDISDLAEHVCVFDAFQKRKRRSLSIMTYTQRINWVRESLKRPVYQGVLNEKRTDYKNVRGDWEPIISSSVFSRVQERLNGKQVVGRNQRLDEFPLKGVVKCESCGLPLTASTSTSRGKSYTYYHCQGRKGHCLHARASVAQVHEQFESLLDELETPACLEERIVERVEMRAKDYRDKNNKRRVQAQQFIDNAKDMEKIATEAFLRGDIDLEEKKGVIDSARATAKHHSGVLSSLTDLDDEFVSLAIANGRRYCSKPLETWKRLPQQQKWRFARGFFPNGMTMRKMNVRNVESLAMSTLEETDEPHGPLWHPQRDSNPCRHLERVVS